MKSPSRKASPVILIVPFLVIAAALGVGGLLNREKTTKREAKSQAPPIGPVIYPGEKAKGLGTPAGAEMVGGVGEPGNDSRRVVAWASLNIVGDKQEVSNFASKFRNEVKDETGKTWTALRWWWGSTLFVGITKGYTKVPKKLTSTCLLNGKPFTTFDLPTLPKPEAVNRPVPDQPWSGLVIQPYPLNEGGQPWRNFYIDSPLGPGHLLAAAFSGTNYSNDSNNYYQTVKGPDAVNYEQTCSFGINHPEADAKAYIEVIDLAPVHFHKQVHFKQMPSVDKFGALWFTSSSNPVQIYKDVYVRLNGTDQVPFRAPSRGRRSMFLEFETSGRIRHVKARLLSPTSVRSTSLSLRASPAARDCDVSTAMRGPDWSTGALDIVVDVEADLYRTEKQATVEVDLTKSVSPKPTKGTVRADYNFAKSSKLHFLGRPGRGGGPGLAIANFARAMPAPMGAVAPRP